ncbi:hypothetical protein ACFVUH_08335 [Kitasatospora sp. NPDC058032]|uniref:hypothetical protein n=1 Tax=Kitasatospora sp. NPDC058032 TaxID=3346307 RepID=UPI0036DFA029
MNATPAVFDPLPASRLAAAALPYPTAVPARLARTYVEVRPAYLAPATARFTAMALRTLSAALWRRTSQPDGAEFRHPPTATVVTVSARSVRTADRLVASGPNWQARFSAAAPDEVLAHAVAALVEHAAHGSPDADPDAALEGLSEAGWSGTHHDGTLRSASPDSLAHVSWGRDEDTGQPSLRVVAGHPGGLQWDAEVSGAAIPDLLTESLLSYLASPAPARRRLGDVPADLLQDLDVVPENARSVAAVRTSAGPSPAAGSAPQGVRILTPPAADRPVRRPR